MYMPAHDPPKTFAVDGPDGTSNAMEDAEVTAIEQTHNFVAETPPKIFAVDAPDGESDGMHQDELHEVEDIIDSAALHEDKAQVMRSHAEQEEARQAILKGRYYG